ncbi:MAG: SDR family NAD(P)-dependent oxidoreductase [Ferruginibacter sp.]
MHNKNYCLITGASEGFGKALSIECATRNINLILVALPGPELYNLSSFIKRNYAVEVIAIEKDLSKEDNCVALFEEVSALNIKVNMLINNAGLGSTMLFNEGSIQLYQTQIKLNILATTLVTRLFIGILEKNSPAYILNVGSLSSFFFLAKKQVYGGTKSYIYFFSKSLRRELKPEGIRVSVICPGAMNTNTSITLLNRSCNWLARQAVMDPENVAPIAIDGLLKGKEVIFPGRMNRLFLFFDKLLPAIIKEKITGHQLKSLNSVTIMNAKLQPVPVAEKIKPYSK